MIVLQSLPLWLPLTSPWLFNQVSYLPAPVQCHVVAERTANLEFYAYPRLKSLDGKPVRHYCERALRSVGVRNHLGLVASEAKRLKADIIHSHWGDWGWRDLGAVRRAGGKHVVTFYGKDVNFLPQQEVWQRRYRELLSSVDLVLCEGPHMASRVIELGLSPERVRVQHLGVERAELAFKPRRWRSGEPLRVLMAASFREKKGLPYAIEALGRLDLPIELTIIGDASEDPRSHPEKKMILEVLAYTGLASATKLMGYQPHAVMLKEAYKAHVFISPSLTAADGDTEGGAPVSLIEMAATGMPVISTLHCDIPEVVVQREWLAPERDVDGLVGILRRLIDTPDWTPQLRAGRIHVEQEFDVRVQAGRLADAYRSLL